jgi:hypothetical protein
VIAVLALLPALAGADEVLLKGGGKVSGRILTRTDTAVQVDVGAGIITVPMASVLSIEEKRSALDDYEERAAKLRANDVPGWSALARWSLSQGLGTQARGAYERVLGIDPQNVEANQGLGRVLVDGRWVTELEVHRARGLVEFEGAWLTPAERDAILEQRDAHQQAGATMPAPRARPWAAYCRSRSRAATVDAAGAVGGIPLWYGGSYGVGGFPAFGYTRPPYGGKRRRNTPGNPWPPLGMYPSHPIGMWPSYPIGPAGSFPIGPAGTFPIGPSPPASVRGPGGGGRHQGGSRPSSRRQQRPSVAPAAARTLAIICRLQPWRSL